MGFLMKRPRQQEEKPQPVAPVKPKKGKCKIKFKRKEDEEQIEFSPECTSQQIEMAKKMRAERQGTDNE